MEIYNHIEFSSYFNESTTIILRCDTQSIQLYTYKGLVVKQKSLNLTMYFAKAEAHLTLLYKIHPAMGQSSGFILTTEIMIPYPKYHNRRKKMAKT